MKKNTLDYINEIYTGGYKNALTYVNSISPVTGEESGDVGGPGYLCFTSTGTSTVRLQNDGGNAPVLFYSTDKKNWVPWDYSTITLNDGESVYFYGENPSGFSKDSSTYSQFTMTGSIAASGNIQTLLSQNGDREDVTEYCYYQLFLDCTTLTSAHIDLPATTISYGCYSQMFERCTALTEGPTVLPATTLAVECYLSMFYDCTALKYAPELPATTLVMWCYNGMFYGCRDLSGSIVLPATALEAECYRDMFTDCINLQSVTTYVTDWRTTNTRDWLSGAGTKATNPTVYCPADSTIPSNSGHGIPRGWTRVDI